MVIFIETDTIYCLTRRQCGKNCFASTFPFVVFSGLSFLSFSCETEHFFPPVTLFLLSRILQIKTKDNYSEGKTGRIPTTLKFNELLHIKYTLSHVCLFFLFFFLYFFFCEPEKCTIWLFGCVFCFSILRFLKWQLITENKSL